MRKTKKILKYTAIILAIPVVYLIISLILTYIPVNKNNDYAEKKHSIYLSSNGVHLEIITHKNDLKTTILDGQIYNNEARFFSFGWGDKNFYVETLTWADLTFINGFRALCVNSSTLLHVTRYEKIQKDWVEVKISKVQLDNINTYIDNTFRLDNDGKKILLPGLGYYKNDDFYEAIGNYTGFNTCNTWVNTALKESDIKACLWTPFDFGLLNMHKNNFSKLKKVENY
ncbi:TIGR02117 family protein [Aquimarina sp. 2304DJ70-9]|uniref:TIGR02117 family protein n=1 Tax=Aquimarina penaris TaxID=3231044 RepID=UPI00346193A3